MRSASMAPSRRGFLVTAGLAALDTVVLQGFARGQRAQSTEAKPGTVLVLARRNYAQGRFYFDPAGVFLEVGQTVRWENSDWGFNVSAFHPEIENHELRIPEAAQPFDSGLMVEGASFEWTFRVEGTYDYYSRSMKPLVRWAVLSSAGPAGRQNSRRATAPAKDARRCSRIPFECSS